ncbi:MAG TPA: DNA internalization-related competence protein ComEC/Rec2 [Burkholderiaceae bacterium]
MDAAAVDASHPARGSTVARDSAAARRSGTGMRLALLALAWLAGVALQLQQAELWPALAYRGLVGAGVVAGVLALRRGRGQAAWAAAAAALLGLGVSGWQAGARLADALPAALEGADVQLTGTVASLPQEVSNGTRFRFAVESARVDGRAVQVPALIALGWYRRWDDEATLADPDGTLRAGQRWRFTARLRSPHGQVNPHGFDFELWLFEQGVRATGYVRATREARAERLAEAAGHPVERARQRVRDAIEARVGDPRVAGVLAALAVGDQNAIERDDWDLYRNAGIAHLMSISGLHITMFAWLAGLLVAAAWRRSARLALALPTPQAARWAGLAAAFAYALFSGWGVPAQRTVCMLAVTTLLVSLGRRWSWPLVLLAAAVTVTAFDPWALLQPGFWLSFVAVGLLMASEPARERRVEARAAPAARRALGQGARLAREALRTQVVATLGLAPLSLVFFQQLSLVGLVANLAAIPLVTLVVTPLALLGVLAPPLWTAGAAVVQALNAGLAALTALPGAVWSVPVAPAWSAAAGLLAGALVVLPLPTMLRALALPLAVPLLWPAASVPVQGEFELLAADVGQGTAVLVRTRAHLLVYDAGPQYSPDSDAGQRVLLPLLRARGESRIDALVLSHRDTDHVGGAAALLRALPVDALWTSLDATHPLLAAAASRSVRCAAGQSWQWDGVRFEMLHPPAADYAHAVAPNALSCVLRVQGSRHAALLAGDIEHAQETALRVAAAQAVRADLLLVPHHGSRTSSSAGFLDAVAPRTAVFQAGWRNRFGHPAPDVVERYRERAIEPVATPSCGAFTWQSADAAGRCEREATRRYWRHRAAPP